MPEEDPYKLYRTYPLDVNDPTLRRQLKDAPLPDSGAPIADTKNLTVEDLEKLNEEHSGQKHISSLSGEQRDQVEEYLHSKGITPGRKRSYFYSR